MDSSAKQVLTDKFSAIVDILTERQDDYDAPPVNFEKLRIAAEWVFKVPVTREQVALFFMFHKAIREANKSKPDNLDDLVGYVGCSWLITEDNKRTTDELFGGEPTVKFVSESWASIANGSQKSDTDRIKEAWANYIRAVSPIE